MSQYGICRYEKVEQPPWKTSTFENMTSWLTVNKTRNTSFIRGFVSFSYHRKSIIRNCISVVKRVNKISLKKLKEKRTVHITYRYNYSLLQPRIPSGLYTLASKGPYGAWALMCLLRVLRGHSHYESEIDLSQKQSECERSNANWNRSKRVWTLSQSEPGSIL